MPCSNTKCLSSQLSRFDRTLLFSSGIGITHCLSIFTDAIVKGDKESHLIWTMRDPCKSSVSHIHRHGLPTDLNSRASL